MIHEQITMIVKIQFCPKMERTLECSPYTILEDSEIYVKISVFAKSNVDLIVTHKPTFPQPPLNCHSLTTF